MDRFEKDSLPSLSVADLPASLETTAPASSKAPPPTPSFSMFEDAMLDAVRNLNQNPTLRREVGCKIS